MLPKQAARAIADLKKLAGRPLHIPWYIVALVVVAVIALDLRIQSVVHSEVQKPLRADAGEYVLYAHNLKHAGVYSLSDTVTSGAETHPTPDAKRSPLYPMFISLFLSQPLKFKDIENILLAQALLSTVTVLAAFWLFYLLLPVPYALAATVLTAISPHLVTMNIYVLSETLFCLWLVVTLWLVTQASKRKNVWLFFASGLTLGLASLTHPAALYFFIPLGAYVAYYFRKQLGGRKAAWLLLGFALINAPWIARNLYTLGAPGDNTLMLAALRVGAYRDMMYYNDPKTYGHPYAEDPQYKETTKDLNAVVTEMLRAFKEDPLDHTRWYLIGKPIELWSWNMAAGSGDVFMYHVYSTPYQYLPQFKATHALMRVLHWPLVILMIAGVVLVWLPPRYHGLAKDAMFPARAISLLLLYHLGIMIVGFPEPRYSIPMRPFMYGMAALSVAALVHVLRTTRQR
jgi:4-amino-4-deoxy-L-arabinose transferase-like glycosyltransferase